MKNNNEITYQLTKEDEKQQEYVKALVAEINGHDNQSIYKKIQLGIELVNIKKENPKIFFNIILEDIISRKSVTRYMKRVVKLDVDFAECMKTTGNTLEPFKRVKKLVLDDRVTKLTLKNIETIPNCTLEKIDAMKSLTPADWKKVVAGDDEPYIKHMEKLSEKNKENKEKQILAKKPEGMDEQVFLDTVAGGLFPTINNLYDFSVKNEELEKKVEELNNEIESLKKLERKQQEEIKMLEGKVEGIMTTQASFVSMDSKVVEQVA